MAASDVEIEYDVDEDIVIDESNLEQFNFFYKYRVSPRWFNYSRWDVPKHRPRIKWSKFVNEDDISMAEVLESNKTTADKMPLIFICPVCGKKYKQQISYAKHLSQCELQEDDTVTNKAHKLSDDNSTSISKLANGKFFS